MAESIVFVIIGGVFVSVLVVALGWHQIVDPFWIVIFFFILLIPGLWGAFTTGPFVPSGRKRYATMLKLAGIQPTDTVYELGAGSFTLIFTAAKQAKRAIGYEISIPLVWFAKLRKWITGNKTEVRFANIWHQDYRDADVIFCYLMPNSMQRLYREIWPTLKPGARLVTNAFQMHDLKPVQSENSVHLYRK